MIKFNRICKYFCQNVEKFSSINFESKDEKGLIPKVGRAWRPEELRLKSNEDLHKLWYVLLIERNSIVSDKEYLYRMKKERYPEPRIHKIKISMARLLTIISERKKIVKNYREQLENEYIEKKQKEFKDKYDNLKEEEKIKVPKITFNLLRAKYHDLKRGIDNIDYIKESVELNEKKENLLKNLKEKYDYKNKKIIYKKKESNNNEKNEQKNENIQGFNNFILEQIQRGDKKVSNEEILRAHIKNWKILTLKQRRVITSMLNAKRSREAKTEFLKELSLLSQKIAYDKKHKN